MRRSWRIAAGAIVLVVVAVAAFLISRRGVEKEQDTEAVPIASVTVAQVRSQVLTDESSAYGVVQADPSGVVTLTAPRDLIVQSVLVSPGQPVPAGRPVIVVASAPAATMAYRQAVTAVAIANNDLDRIRRLAAEHLAANDQLSAAEKTLADARAALAAQQQQGAGAASQVLKAPAASVVTAVAVVAGDRVAQNAALVTLARDGAVNAKLGLEPGAGPFAPGEAVVLRSTAGGPSTSSRLVMVGRATDPTTRTIDATAPLQGLALAIGAGVEADVVTGSHRGLTVPRAAVVFDETGDHLFIIRGGKAQRVFVNAGRDYGNGIEVKGPIAAGQQVAVQGAYELQDGMAVKVAAAR